MVMLPEDAMSLLLRYKLFPPIDLAGLTRRLGLRVTTQFLPEGQSGKLIKHGDDKGFEIVINRNDPIARRRFTLAHELGHWYLHRDLMEEGTHVDRLFVDGKMANPPEPFRPFHEWDANRFAADLLMPDAEVKSFLQTPTNAPRTIDQVAKHFEVSKQAAAIRIDNLGLTRFLHDRDGKLRSLMKVQQ